MNSIEALKELIDYIHRRLPGEEKIDASEHNRILKVLVDTLLSASSKIFLGHAKPDTIPSTPAKDAFYLATKKGNYVHFGDLQINSPLALLIWNGQDWQKEEIEVEVNQDINIDDYIDLSNYAKLSGDNTFNGNQKIIGELEIGESRGKLRPVARQSRQMEDKQAVAYNALLGILETVKQVPDAILWNTNAFQDYIDQAIRTTDDVTFNKVVANILETSGFVNSLFSGKGAGIDERGNAQVESLEVRGSAKFMELIINRLLAQESDFVFTESGTIDKVEELEPGTYLLTIRKRWDFDFTAFREHDIAYGSINTLLSDGSYFTSWFRVLSVDTSANTLTVATYPDNEVPAGKNFAPAPRMNISRRGNAVNEDRQSCWYISSFEGCIMYLEGVTKPILDESNYYLSLGKPKHLELFNGLPINYKHPYIFARGAIIQDLLRIDFQGNPIYEIVDLGLWDAAMQYIRGKDSISGKYLQHQVWYRSCCWRCVIDMATVGLPPRWNNTQWVCVVGDSNFTLEITSTKGRFFRFGQEYTTLGFTLKHGEMDVSVDAWQVEWTRESGLPEEDLLWNTEHAGNVETVDITPQDMPSNWYEVKKVAFRCTVFLRDGETVQSYSESFSINK